MYHAINRGDGRTPLFRTDREYLAFLALLEEGRQHVPMRILGYCLMSDHWHLVLWPRSDGDLSNFIRWVCTTQVRRWRMRRRSAGAARTARLYQGRFKCFPIQPDEHLLKALRYVETSPLRASRVKRAELWSFSSLSAGDRAPANRVQLDAGPVARPTNWKRWVNQPIAADELVRLDISLQRGRPYGTDRWTHAAATRLGLESTLRPIGRPKKSAKKKV